MYPYLIHAGKMLFTMVATPVAIARYVVGKCFSNKISRRKTQNWLDASIIATISTPHPVEHRCYKTIPFMGMLNLSLGSYSLFQLLIGGAPNLLVGLLFTTCLGGLHIFANITGNYYGWVVDQVNIHELYIILSDHFRKQNRHINYQNYACGNTPLHIALLQEDTHEVKYLIEKGANLTIKNHNNITPVHLIFLLANKKDPISLQDSVIAALLTDEQVEQIQKIILRTSKNLQKDVKEIKILNKIKFNNTNNATNSNAATQNTTNVSKTQSNTTHQIVKNKNIISTIGSDYKDEKELSEIKQKSLQKPNPLQFKGIKIKEATVKYENKITLIHQYLNHLMLPTATICDLHFNLPPKSFKLFDYPIARSTVTLLTWPIAVLYILPKLPKFLLNKSWWAAFLDLGNSAQADVRNMQTNSLAIKTISGMVLLTALCSLGLYYPSKRHFLIIAPSLIGLNSTIFHDVWFRLYYDIKTLLFLNKARTISSANTLINNPEVNMQDQYGNTPLHRAIYDLNVANTVKLLKRGADLSISNEPNNEVNGDQGLTPFDLALSIFKKYQKEQNILPIVNPNNIVKLENIVKIMVKPVVFQYYSNKHLSKSLKDLLGTILKTSDNKPMPQEICGMIVEMNAPKPFTYTNDRDFLNCFYGIKSEASKSLQNLISPEIDEANQKESTTENKDKLFTL